MEERLKSKTFYKLFLIIVKYTPITMACIETIYTILAYYNIECSILNYIGGTSFITLLILYIASYVFRFCYLYRLSLHYIVVTNCIAMYDVYLHIPLNDLNMLRLYLGILGIFIIIFIRHNVKNNKNNSAKVHR